MCRKHPKYNALHPPATNCDGCWKLWEQKHPGQKIARVPKPQRKPSVKKKKKCGCGD